MLNSIENKSNKDEKLLDLVEDNMINNKILDLRKILEECKELKKQGDMKLKAKNFEESVDTYLEGIHKSVDILKDENITEELLNQIQKDLLIPSYLNITFCYLQLKKWHKVVKYAEKVLDFDKNNVKAKYRRCLAHIKGGKFRKADKELEDLEVILGGTNELEVLEREYEDNKNRSEGNDGELLKKMGRKIKKGVNMYDDKEEEVDNEIHPWMIGGKKDSFCKRIMKKINYYIEKYIYRRNIKMN